VSYNEWHSIPRVHQMARADRTQWVRRVPADGYNCDHSIRFVWFVRHGEVLKIETVDDDRRAAWDRDSRKLASSCVCMNTGLSSHRRIWAVARFATQTLGRAENREANRLAYLRAIPRARKIHSQT